MPEYTYQDVAEHNTKKDLFIVVHDKVYDATKFVDEHPYGHHHLAFALESMGARDIDINWLTLFV